MYAVIETGGKQYEAKEGEVLYVNKIDSEPGSTIDFEKIVMLSSGNKVEFGSPYISGIKVTGKIIKNGKAKKIIVFKYKPKKGYKKKQGHRQLYTKIEITKIGESNDS